MDGEEPDGSAGDRGPVKLEDPVEARGSGPVAWFRRQGGRRRWLVIVVIAVLVCGVVFGGRNLLLGGSFMGQEQQEQLSQQEAVEFVKEHEDSVIVSAKKFFQRQEEGDYLRVESVEIIPESVRVVDRKTPMTKAEGLIYYNYYVNGNRDYEVIGDSMIGPFYRGDLPVNISDPWVPGKVFGDGATVSTRFNEIMAVWDKEMARPYVEARAKRVAGEVAFIEGHKDKVLEFARARYGGDSQVPEIQSVGIDPRTDPNVQFPEGVFVFNFFINGDRRFEVFDCGMVGPEYPGVLRKREDDGIPLVEEIGTGDDGSSLKPGDIVDYLVDEEWRRERF